MKRIRIFLNKNLGKNLDLKGNSPKSACHNLIRGSTSQASETEIEFN